jgi:hypothetical protein
MKKMAWLISIIFTLPVFGQDCQQFLFFQKGKTIEMTIYDNAGGINGKQVYQVLDVASDGVLNCLIKLENLLQKPIVR